MGWYDKLFEAESYQLANGKVVSQKFTRLPLIIVLLLIGISISVWVTGFSLVTLVTNFVGFWQILASMWPPNLAYFFTSVATVVGHDSNVIFGSFLGQRWLCRLPF